MTSLPGPLCRARSVLFIYISRDDDVGGGDVDDVVSRSIVADDGACDMMCCLSGGLAPIFPCGILCP